MAKLTDRLERIDPNGRFCSESSLTAHRILEIRENHVDVWFADFHQPDLPLERFTAILDDTERSRMASFKFEHLRHQFAYAHGLLRMLLSRYVQCDPKTLVFKIGSHGKPELADVADLSFSLSHSGWGVALAIARNMEIGLDIEQIKPIDERRSLIERFFSAQELVLYDKTLSAEQESAFFRLWTRKEAFIKGLGLGLSYPLNNFSVGIDIPITLNGHETQAWSVHHLEPARGFVGALAVRSHAVSPRGCILRIT